MALSITDLKKGTVFAVDGVPYKVTEYQQKVMGRGGSTVNVKIKSLTTGKVLAKTYHGNDQVDSADITTRPVQYLYSDDISFYFMDAASFEQFSLPAGEMDDKKGYLKEGDQASALIFNDQLVSIELPKNLPIKVAYTEDAVKGDTSSSITKDACLETGLVVKVPAFVKTGDTISVDTATSTYRERVK